MNVEIPHFYDLMTGQKVVKDENGNYSVGYYEMSANRKGSSVSSRSTTISQKRLSCCGGKRRRRCTGHVAMVRLQEGDDIEALQVVIANVGISNFSCGAVESGFGRSYNAQYYYHRQMVGE